MVLMQFSRLYKIIIRLSTLAANNLKHYSCWQGSGLPAKMAIKLVAKGFNPPWCNPKRSLHP